VDNPRRSHCNGGGHDCQPPPGEADQLGLTCHYSDFAPLGRGTRRRTPATARRRPKDEGARRVVATSTFVRSDPHPRQIRLHRGGLDRSRHARSSGISAVIDDRRAGGVKLPRP
jgi:hypothetical protein